MCMKKLVSLLGVSVVLLGACSSSTSKEAEVEPAEERAKTGQNKVEQIREKQRKEMKEREKRKQEEEGNDDENADEDEDEDEE